MPRFDFQCRKCSQIFEGEIPFGSKEFPPCPSCSGTTEKLVSPPAIHFKGDGFYKTDSVKKPAEKPQKKQEPSSTTQSSASEDRKEKKPDTKAKDKDSTKR